MKNSLLLGLTGVLFLCLGACAQDDSAATAAAGSQTQKTCKLDSIVFGTGVEQRVLQGVATTFDSTARKIFCWTKLSISAAPYSLKHVWYNGDQKVAEIPLRLKFDSGRLWSYKTVTPGQWKVDVVGENGDVIGSGSFTAK
jgi:hypothetical protein